MTQTARGVTPRVHKAARSLRITMYLQIAVAAAAVPTGFWPLHVASVTLLVVTMIGLYCCRQWRQKWEERSGRDEREQQLYLRARSRALRQLHDTLGPIGLCFALFGLSVTLLPGDSEDLRQVDITHVTWLLLGVITAISALPTLLLIAGEPSDADDHDTVAATAS